MSKNTSPGFWVICKICGARSAINPVPGDVERNRDIIVIRQDGEPDQIHCIGKSESRHGRFTRGPSHGELERTEEFYAKLAAFKADPMQPIEIPLLPVTAE